MKNNSQSLNINQLTKDALNDLFDDNRKCHEAGCHLVGWPSVYNGEDFEEIQLAICEALHNIFVMELRDAVDNKRQMTGEPWVEQRFRVVNDESDYEVEFADGDKFTYDLWMDIIKSFNKHMKHSHFYMTNETN